MTRVAGMAADLGITVEPTWADLAEGSADHPLQAHSARAGLEIIMAMFESALERRAIALPFTRADSPLEEMVACQKAAPAGQPQPS